MKIEEQVCDLEYAKRLKELGVNYDSILYYVPDIPTIIPPNPNYQEGRYLLRSKPFITIEEDSAISAFTVAELFELLPGWNPRPCYLWVSKNEEYEGQYRNDHTGQHGKYISDKKLANMLAKLLIENNLTEV